MLLPDFVSLQIGEVPGRDLSVDVTCWFAPQVAQVQVNVSCIIRRRRSG
jgi:hypothetical protein